MSSADSVESAERRTPFVDVAEGTTDGALQHEAWRTNGGVAASYGRFDGVGDGVNHRVHGWSSGVRHRWLRWRNLARSPVSAPSPTNFRRRVLLFFSVVSVPQWSERVRIMCESKAVFR